MSTMSATIIAVCALACLASARAELSYGAEALADEIHTLPGIDGVPFRQFSGMSVSGLS